MGSDSGFTWAQNIYNGLANANLNAFVYWWGIGDASVAANGCCLASVKGPSVTGSGRLWAFANYSRYVRPGAVRISATSSNSTIETTAYKKTDGSLSIVALNTGSSDDPISYALSGTGTPNGATVTPYLTNATNNTAAQTATAVSGGAFNATIPARSLVTYVIPAAASTGNTVTITNPDTQTATVGSAVSLQIHATDSAAGKSLTYTATGLPSGLSINRSTGLITETPTTAGTAAVTVTAADTTGAVGRRSLQARRRGTPEI
ncbi:MAG TPA: putative Ig domain-containing protein [Mycobacterium sp.]|uniref:putative Ig domain-containing protein n=1 Tax=Mycobacterium sp. TaxID=1785 RepID=UPI002D5C0B6B|nr:putative Ig domain-containing protein [Mycobacterium sp.]HZU46835.1 putative Ig domain-containing protein [Mycobacterium sp.]